MISREVLRRAFVMLERRADGQGAKKLPKKEEPA